MSEESVGALFEYPFNQYLMTRLEFVLIANDELEAKIMRIIEVEMLKLKAIWQKSVLEAIEKKQEPPPEPEEYWVTMSRGLFIAFLYKFDTSAVGAKHPNSISKSSLRRAIDDLIEVKQFLFSRAQPNNEFGPTQYTLNREVIQERMRNLPKHPMSLFLKGYSNLETGGVSNLETPTSQKGNSSVSNLTTPQFSNLRTLNNSNLDNTNLDKDTYSDDVANANHHALALSLEEQLEAARQLLQAHGQYPQESVPSQLSTPTEEISPESVDKSGQNVNDTSVLPQASEQSYSQPTTPPETKTPDEKPARPARQRKPKVDMKPIAPPSKPDESVEWSVEKMLAWGDYARGFVYEPSNHPNSKYHKALMAAKAVVGREITEKQFLIHYFNWMKGVNVDKQKLPDTALVSDYWPTASVDLWVFNDHFEAEKEKRSKTRAELAIKTTQEPGATVRNVTNMITRQPQNVIQAPEGWSPKRKKVAGES